MEDERFDRLVRIIGEVASRRNAMRNLAAVTIGGVLSARDLTAGEARKKRKKKGNGKKKKKCQAPKVRCGKKCCLPPENCQFIRTPTTWTLQDDCTITQSIEIPSDVTLEGNGKTIVMSGPVTGFTLTHSGGDARAAGILAKEGSATIRDLEVTSRDLTGVTVMPVGIAFVETAGTIERVRIASVVGGGHLGQGPAGMAVIGTGGQSVVIRESAVSEVTGFGIYISSGLAGDELHVTISDVTLSGYMEKGIEFTGAGSCTVEGSTVTTTGTDSGIRLLGYAGVFNGSIAGTTVHMTDYDSWSTGIFMSSWDGCTFDGSVSDNTTVFVSTNHPGSTGAIGIDFVVFPDSQFTGSISNTSAEVNALAAFGIQFSGLADSPLNASILAAEVNAFGPLGFGVQGYGNLYTTVADSTLTLHTTTTGRGVLVNGNEEAQPTAVVEIEGSEITSSEVNAGRLLGVEFGPFSSGDIRNSTISGMRDTSPDPLHRSCGIAIYENAVASESGVTFSNNDEDICDPFTPPPGSFADSDRDKANAARARQTSRQSRRTLRRTKR